MTAKQWRAPAHMRLSSGGYCLVDEDAMQMKCIYLFDDGKAVEVDVSRTIWRRSSDKNGKRVSHRYVYATRVVDGRSRTIWLHRLIAMHACYFPAGMNVDHRNGIPLDNRAHNLRAATGSENAWNRRNRNRLGLTSRYKGVRLDNGRWRAEIRRFGKQRHIGTFGCEEAAACAYDAEARRLFGEFARTNFPSGFVVHDRKERKECAKGFSHSERRDRRRLMAIRVSQGASIVDTANVFDVVPEVVRRAVKEFAREMSDAIVG